MAASRLALSAFSVFSTHKSYRMKYERCLAFDVVHVFVFLALS